MTRFIDGSKKSEPKKVKRETVFTHFFSYGKEIKITGAEPKNFDNVEFLFNNPHNGDFFKAWNNGDISNTTLYFGTKGDEDYE